MKTRLLTDNLKRTGSGSQLTLAISFAVIVAFAMYDWTISPQTKYLQAAQQYSQVAEDADIKIAVLEKKIARKQNELESARTEVSAVKGKFFTQDEASLFLSQIQPLADKFDCVLESLVFEPSEYFSDEDSPVAVRQETASIRLTGRFSGLSSFISKLTDQPRDVAVFNIDLKVTQDFMALNCSMSVTIYVIEDKEVHDNVEL